MRVLWVLILISSCTLKMGATTTVSFAPSSLSAGGPFPNNSLTVPDSSQQTGIRINLPSTNDSCDSSTAAVVCSNSPLLNQLDGFSVNPRIMVCFSGPIDLDTLRTGIWFTKPGSTVKLGINQVIYDSASNCAFAKPDNVLDQQSDYLLIITNAVKDSQGQPVAASSAFHACLSDGQGYCLALNQALQNTENEQTVVAASLFTTLSATSWVQKAHQFVVSNEPSQLPTAPVTFSLADLQSLSYIPAQSGLAPIPIPLSALAGVGQVSFGMFSSPNFLNVSGSAQGSITTTPTNQPISPVPVSSQGPFESVSYHVFLPSTPPPPAGYSLVIFGHGFADNQFGNFTFLASTLAHFGFASASIEITGHGYGAASEVEVTKKNGAVENVPTPGRGVLLPGASTIGPTDGCIVPGAVAIRDCLRQTAVDLFAFVQNVKFNRLGLPLDPQRIYYAGQSLGAIYGTLVNATEPAIRAAVFSGDGSSQPDVARLSPEERAIIDEIVVGISPALLNVPPAPPQQFFDDQINDNYVFRDVPPVVNDVPGALAIQAALEAVDWNFMIGDPLSFAPHLSAQPFPGNAPKPVLFQYGLGDLEVPNPTESAIIRAAQAENSFEFFRFDLASQISPDLPSIMTEGVTFPIMPHRVLANPTVFTDPSETPLALAVQQQAGLYLLSDGTVITPANSLLTGKYAGANLFQVPAKLPTQLNYFQLPQ